MDFLTGKIKPMYFKYLSAAFGSSFAMSIYSCVDMAMVGQYQGPEGTAALAVVAPLWNIINSLGFLMGIGGSVIFATLRGESERNRKRSNEVFTASLIGGAILALISWIAIVFFDDELLTLFGAEETLLPVAKEYLVTIKMIFPSFLFVQLVSAYLRNDGAPGLATKGVLIGGVFNILGDYIFIFPMGMGVFGGGLATSLGSVFSLLIMLTHFFSKKNTLRLERPTRLLSTLGRINLTGFSTFFVDIAMGILTILFNRQILTYLGTDALAVYGIIINISTFVQCCAYSVGQAAQPIISTNYGAKQGGRIREVLKYALGTAAAFGIVWTLMAMIAPDLFVRIFMAPTERILEIAPYIIRVYGISFLLLPFNIFSTYYFQALLKPQTAFIVSVARGAVISGGLILLLPLVTENALWFAMPITELLVAVFVVVMMIRYTKKLSNW